MSASSVSGCARRACPKRSAVPGACMGSFGRRGQGDVAAVRVLVRRVIDRRGARGRAVRGDRPVVCGRVGRSWFRRGRALLRQPRARQAGRRGLRIDVAGGLLGGAAVAVLGLGPRPGRAIPDGARKGPNREPPPAPPAEPPPWVLWACLVCAGFIIAGTWLCWVVTHTPWVVMLVGWILICAGGGTCSWLYSRALRQQSTAEPSAAADPARDIGSPDS
jgi:hypothetical protein